ncbi:MAG: UDP-N-acetylmuramoyl-tripeptide--D-alanyl-D-alanine ligase [Gemmatimonadaceae bacterium]|nr:UDP-N-acetylmuramoyl-tripeptide--D-alanyl-D-alanine ligase [Gemmatimonadaceae bacterium]MCW5824949.1 UDP-N-acetylmuramoyl-tripeptide--D-alanyl-D-alanine ligase [Gemmatimonadaceae bacterium]
MAFWTLERLVRALDLPLQLDARPVAGISTDTRTLAAGAAFVALRGERFDAHDHLEAALAAGASALIVADARRAPLGGVPVLEVPDTLVALGQLARYRRDAWAKPVIAVGGSNGKTSTKELLRAALGSVYAVHATTGNLNNRIGVPLTLLALPDDADLAVVEAGTNEPGEIAALRAIIRPDVAVITTVQEEHLEGFGDLAGVMAEEMSLCDEVPLAVVPAEEPEVVAEAQRRAGRCVTAGLDAGDHRATKHGLEPDGRGWAECEGVRLRVPLPGAHNLRNATLAMAVAAEFGVPASEAAAGIAAMPQPAMRSAVAPLGRALLVNDCYNSNPGSAVAALALLRDVGAGRQRVAVLGTMRELGAASERAHREVAEAALASGAELVVGLGEFAAPLRAAGAGERVLVARDVDDLWPLLEPRLAPDAAILLKASRGVALERLVPHLTTWAHA